MLHRRYGRCREAHILAISSINVTGPRSALLDTHAVVTCDASRNSVLPSFTLAINHYVNAQLTRTLGHFLVVEARPQAEGVKWVNNNTECQGQQQYRLQGMSATLAGVFIYFDWR
jgi:hypothetical protein